MTDRTSFQKLQEELQVESNHSEWTIQEVGSWLDKIGLGEHANAFAKAILFLLMRAVARRHGQTTLKTYVDNIRLGYSA